MSVLVDHKESIRRGRVDPGHVPVVELVELVEDPLLQVGVLTFICVITVLVPAICYCDVHFVIAAEHYYRGVIVQANGGCPHFLHN